MKKKVAILEDNNDFRQWIEEEILLMEEFECVGSFGFADQALKNIPYLEPDMVLVDIGLEGSTLNGIEVMMRLKVITPTLKFLVITGYSDEERVFEALKVGAGAYILKDEIPTRLHEAMREFAEGGAPMSPEIANKVIRSFHQPVEQTRELQTLTPREIEILDLISKGYLNKEIKEKLGISENTVKVISHHIYQKLQVNNRVEAARKYLNL